MAAMEGREERREEAGGHAPHAMHTVAPKHAGELPSDNGGLLGAVSDWGEGGVLAHTFDTGRGTRGASEGPVATGVQLALGHQRPVTIRSPDNRPSAPPCHRGRERFGPRAGPIGISRARAGTGRSGLASPVDCPTGLCVTCWEALGGEGGCHWTRGSWSFGWVAAKTHD